MTNHVTDTNNVYGPVSWFPGSAKLQGGLSVALGAAFWGLFWIPLRFLDERGVNGFWAVALVMFALIFPSILVLLRINRFASLRSPDAWFIGCALGLSIVLYFTGIIVSDVIRVVFLFYLLPVWTTISARILYKEPITSVSLFVIALALAGLWLLLGGENKIPMPSNFGDWCGLLAGLCWGVSLSVIRGKEDVDASAMVCTTAIGATLIATAAALLLPGIGAVDTISSPALDSRLFLLVISILFAFILLYPSLIGQIWGAQRVAAPTAALLTMSEVLVATISAYLLVGTDLTTSSIIGAVIILIAVLTDIAVKYRQQNQNST